MNPETNPLLSGLFGSGDEQLAMMPELGAPWTYRQFAAEVATTADRLGAGRSLRARPVAVVMADPARAIANCCAALSLGAVVVPLAPGPEERRQSTLTRLRPCLVVDGESFNECPDSRLFEGPWSAAALVLATSGSRGPPKFVALRGSGIAANIAGILRYFHLTKGCRVGIVLPLHYGYALIGQAFVGLQAGATLVFANHTSYATEQLSAMRRHDVVVLSSVPSSLALLARTALDLPLAERPALRLIGSAGGRLSSDVVALVKETFPDAVIWNQYGLTEASPRVSSVSSCEPAFARGSIGKPLDNLEVVVCHAEGRPAAAGEVGELIVRGESIMLGYLDDEEATARALEGGLHTGDLVHQDRDGYLYYHERADDIVKCAGERVSLEEVAQLLRQMPHVRDAAVVAISDDLAEHRLIAFVVVDKEEPGFKSLLLSRLRKQLGSARAPRKIEFVATVPLTSTGKADIPTLRQWATRAARS